jgi:hypothetical protein
LVQVRMGRHRMMELGRLVLDRTVQGQMALVQMELHHCMLAGPRWLGQSRLAHSLLGLTEREQIQLVRIRTVGIASPPGSQWEHMSGLVAGSPLCMESWWSPLVVAGPS